MKKYYTNNKGKFDTPETVHARHILIKVDDKDDKKTKDKKMAKIEGIRKQLLKGTVFEKLAKEHSDCPSKEKGGDLGTFKRGNMEKSFEDAAFTQKVNEIGPIVKTKFGNHIIQVLEHNKAKSKSLDEVKDNIRKTLEQQKKQEIMTGYIAKLKENAKIVYGTTDASKK
jgi:peptidyl-prolyl cis-trans isomerase C